MSVSCSFVTDNIIPIVGPEASGATLVAKRHALYATAPQGSGHEQACYRPLADLIEMPDRERFIDTSTSNATENYYATLLHELTHWTGHPSRLNRELANRFGDEAYAMEELIAELGAAFLCADLGVTNTPRLDHAAYVNTWLKKWRARHFSSWTKPLRGRVAVPGAGLDLLGLRLIVLRR